MRFLIVVIFFSSQLIAQNVKFKIDTTLTCSKQKFDSLMFLSKDLGTRGRQILDSNNNTIMYVRIYTKYYQITNVIDENNLLDNFFDTISNRLEESYFNSYNSRVGLGVKYDYEKQKYNIINHDSLFNISHDEALKIFKKKFKKLEQHNYLDNGYYFTRKIYDNQPCYWIKVSYNKGSGHYLFILNANSRKFTQILYKNSTGERFYINGRNLGFRHLIKLIKKSKKFFLKSMLFF